ncbi:uncharacterized protein LOC134282839 [Saccostrea cucullata]|uniref:uncharacterized protein LOC134282839 n=1 Tax=Saccostrea cuccullata TaxID=36930 RepID=UPI002ECFD4C3
MNKGVVFVASACMMAVVIVQVSALWGTQWAANPRFAATGGVAARQNYYDNYYRRYQAYNDAQQLRVLTKSVNDLSMSSTLSLLSLLFFSFIATNSTGTIAG